MAGSIERAHHSVEMSEVRLLLRFAANHLTPRQREALVSVVLNGQTDRDVAARTGVTFQAVYQARKKAVVLMRRKLATLRIHGIEDMLS
jgi:DNA-directed RNA polymerase specialized sigma24 family protein